MVMDCCGLTILLDFMHQAQFSLMKSTPFVVQEGRMANMKLQDGSLSCLLSLLNLNADFYFNPE
jgi:hypothetical protein